MWRRWPGRSRSGHSPIARSYQSLSTALARRGSLLVMAAATSGSIAGRWGLLIRADRASATQELLDWLTKQGQIRAAG